MGIKFLEDEGSTEPSKIRFLDEQVAQVTPKEDNPLLRGWGVGMRPVIQGLSAPVNAVADGAAGLVNLGANLAGSDFRAPYLSKVQSEGLNNRTYEGQQVYPEGQTLGEQIVQGATGAVAGSIGMGGFAPKLIPGSPGAMASTTAGGGVAPAAYEGTKEWTGSDLAATGASLLASMVAGGAAGKSVDAFAGRGAPKVTMAEVEKRAKDAYATLDASGVTLKPLSAQAMVNRIEGELRKNNYRPAVNPRVETVLNQLREDIGTQKVSFQQLEQLRGVANALKTDPDPNTQRLGSLLIREFDNQVSKVEQRDLMRTSNVKDFKEVLKAVESARSDWRALSKAGMLEDVLDMAELRKAMPAASESELIRAGFMKIATNKTKMKQFSTDEQEAIKQVVKGIPFDRTLGQLARLNPARSQIMVGAQGSAAGAALGSGNPGYAATAAGLAGLGFGADKLGGALRKGQAEKAIQQILSGKKPVSEEDIHSLRGLFGGAINLDR